MPEKGLKLPKSTPKSAEKGMIPGLFYADLDPPAGLGRSIAGAAITPAPESQPRPAVAPPAVTEWGFHDIGDHEPVISSKILEEIQRLGARLVSALERVEAARLAYARGRLEMSTEVDAERQAYVTRVVLTPAP